ncbi:hypothetical protein THAOC_29223 [Thalassiosira oceanica]|uniref:Uncharacterized protein n=1 Tax=Thalassiosira oceanica TaxID=159749 RepID=K0RRQ7_THAOC|nr:hypothetical protein THAOC_29223 [Thalassiosira oceanica]|eukprot:EJK51591.1 hypothetical protein THAOC_29223 [Thalassiosira oceanica]
MFWSPFFALNGLMLANGLPSPRVRLPGWRPRSVRAPIPVPGRRGQGAAAPLAHGYIWHLTLSCGRQCSGRGVGDYLLDYETERRFGASKIGGLWSPVGWESINNLRPTISWRLFCDYDSLLELDRARGKLATSLIKCYTK